MIDVLYNQLIKTAIKQNRMLSEQQAIKLEDYHTLYRHTMIPFDDRELIIRWVKIPTFKKQNRRQYYIIFLVNIKYWRKGELKAIYKQCIDTIDYHDIDSYTIFLQGKVYGYFDPILNIPMKNYHVFRLQGIVFTKEHNQLITDFIIKFLETRIYMMKKDEKIFGVLQQDIDRLNYLIETFSAMRVITRMRTYESSIVRDSQEWGWG